MDNKSKFVKNSIQFKLSLWLSSIIIIMAIIGSVFGYLKSLYEAKELQDDTLLQVSDIIDNYNIPIKYENVGHEEFRIFIRDYPDKYECANSQDCIILPDSLQNGFNNYNYAGNKYRILIKQLNNGERVAIFQKTNARDETAQYTAIFTAVPLLLLIGIIIICVIIAINSAFRPMQNYAKLLANRQEGNYSKIEFSKTPYELEPFLKSINDSMEKLEKSMQAQKDLVANAAHELRTPLTAISLQIENLDNLPHDKEANHIINNAKNTINISKQLIENLLDFTRVSSPSTFIDNKIKIKDSIRNIIELYLPIIEDKNLEIELEAESAKEIILPKFEADIIIKNIIDNAIKFSPNNGNIFINIDTKERPKLIIENAHDNINSNYINDIDLENLTKPFFRGASHDVSGSGLGLAIVKKALDKIGGSINIYHSKRFKSGLAIEIIFLN